MSKFSNEVTGDGTTIFNTDGNLKLNTPLGNTHNKAKKSYKKNGLKGVTRILFLGSNPDGPSLKLSTEFTRIKGNLKKSKERDNLILSQEWVVTPEALMQAMLDEKPHILHISSHGTKSGIIIEGKDGQGRLLPTNNLAGFFELFKKRIKCVLLNSCYSNTQAKEIRKHIPYVIGMSDSISDTGAIIFATGFYQALGAGESIPFSFEAGKKAMLLEECKDSDLPLLFD